MYRDRRKKQTSHAPRRRAQDAVLWREQDEWVVYDSVSDGCYRYPAEEHDKAIAKLKELRGMGRNVL